jgi:hypothetical protein
MRRLAQVWARVAWLLTGTAAAIVLIVGVAEARTSRMETLDCLYHPPTFLGSCTSNAHCQELCLQWNPQPVQGECWDGCCSCVI